MPNKETIAQVSYDYSDGSQSVFDIALSEYGEPIDGITHTLVIEDGDRFLVLNSRQHVEMLIRSLCTAMTRMPEDAPGWGK